MSNQVLNGYRLSPQQKHVWLLQQAGRGDAEGAYGAAGAYLVEGALDRDALRRALGSVVRRHEILRTTFALAEGLTLPLQVVADPEGRGADFEEHDLTALGEAESRARVDDIFRRTLEATRDLERVPALRASLVALSAARHLLVVGLPALCADATTVGGLMSEIARAYAEPEDDGGANGDADGAGDAGADGDGEVEAMQYADFAEWQHEVLAAEEAEGRPGFWSRQDLSSLVGLSNGRAGDGAARGFSPTARELSVSREAAEAAAAAAEACGVSESVFLLACWKVLLFRSGGRAEVLVGAASQGRNYAELEGALGLYERYLPVLSRLDGRTRLSALASALEAETREAYEWQESFAWDRLGDGPDGEVPFFPCAYEYGEEAPPCEAGGLTFTLVRRSVCTERYRLKLSCSRGEGGLRVTLHTDAGSLSEQEAGLTAARFETLLVSAAADVHAPVGELEILGEAERRLLLEEFARTPDSPAPELCFTQMFEERAAAAPGGVAVVCEDEQLTYGELNARANRLARRLKVAGVGPESVVGISLERSAEMVVAVLGVLKAGGAYLPLNPALPARRLAAMLEDARPKVLLAAHGRRESLEQHGVPVMSPAADGEEAAAPDAENLPREVSGENLAYVIYTSGSTGSPKGVGVEHRQLANYLKAAGERLELGGVESFAMVSTFAADLGHTSLFTALASGGRLHVLTQERASDPQAAADYFARHRVDLLKIVPSHFNALLSNAEPGAVVPRRRLVLGGEAAGRDLARRVREADPGCAVFNHYGPTETTVGVLAHRIEEPGEAAQSATLPLGRPMANTRVYLLDERRQLVPAGAAGEIYVGGAGLARGYLRAPGLTAERFVPDPFSGEPGARLYRTGDLARHLLPSGLLEFLGRADDQVKVRGFRVEPGEVEAALRRHPAVRDAFVNAHAEGSGERRLAAYVVSESPLGAAELRDFLSDEVPDYMVPSFFVTLDALPLNANGKVDRRALPAPTATHAASAGAAGPPRNPIEDVVAGVWCEVLGAEAVGPRDDFFALGGHSLLATQVISRVREIFAVEVPLRELFDSPTVAGLAEAVHNRLRAADGLTVPPLEPVSRRGPLPLSFAQQRLWFLDRLEPGNPFYNCPGAIPLPGPIDVGALEKSLNEMIRRHEVLRTTFVPVDGVPVQVIAPSLTLPLPVIDLRDVPQEERAERARRIAGEEASRPFDLTRGPLLRASLLRLAEHEHVALLTTHHIVSDGWSMGVLLGELGALYEAYEVGHESPLPELPVQYADYAVWQREWLEAGALERQLGYWRERLAGVEPLEVPGDRPRPAAQTHRGAHATFEFGPELSAALAALARREGATPFMVLLAGFQALLHRYTGQQDITVGTDVAGRNHRAVEGLIGFFINQLVLRGRVSGAMTFRELIAGAKETCVGAYAHQDVPFEKLVEELQPERDLSRPPLFQVKFVFQSAVGRPAEGGAVSAADAGAGFAVEIPTSKFDMTVAVSETSRGLRLLLEYSTDLYDDTTIARFVSHYERLLAAAADSPDLRVRDLPLLSDEERESLLHARNRTEAPYESGRCLHELFEERARLAPDSPAVVFEGGSVSYAELNGRANRLAHYLRGQGVGPEVRVGVCVERSGAEAAVAILGVLKAGGAYVPLDASYPLERLSFMLEDSQVPVLITTEALSDRLPAHWSQPLFLDTDWELIAECSDEDPRVDMSPDSLAYVIYTSGSTGTPKAALLHHRGASNLSSAQLAAFSPDSSSRVLQFSSLSFDASVFDILMALLSGAQLHLASREQLLPGPGLAALLRDRRVTHLTLPPSALAALPPAELPDLRVLVVAGEALPEELVGRWSAPGRRLFNAYGPTETTVWATAAECLPGTGKPPIGRPIRNARAYVLDAGMGPVPEGAAGELYVGGAGVGRGYLNRPSLTAERFVPDPYSSEPGARLYRTGDVARWGAGGGLEYVGRADGQVKVRGHRVELGEVEAVLAGHPGVREAAAAVRGEGAEARLVGYYVRGEGAEVGAGELRQYMRGRVPEYMVPSAVVELSRMPVSGSGKLDRGALPDGPDGRAAGTEFTAPRNAVEEVLADIWSQLLGVGRVGVEDNFFDLGGHSLLATQIILRVQAVFQVEIAIRTLFESPTVAALAQAVVGQEGRPGQAEKVARVLLKVKSMSAEDVNASLQGKQEEGVSA